VAGRARGALACAVRCIISARQRILFAVRFYSGARQTNFIKFKKITNKFEKIKNNTN
jgi:hypothetical protein